MSQESEPVLSGHRLSRTFGDGEVKTTALRSASLDLYRGQLALLMGPSGSGKTTLMTILSGLQSPTTGDVIGNFHGRRVSLWEDLNERERDQYRLENCGYIFQGYNLFPALSARQQLEIVLNWGGLANGVDAKKQSREMLATLGLGKKDHLLPAQLSGGEKQRVAIGRALVKNPTLCFADEPTSALDWSHGEQVIELLRTAAHERGSTILVVTHDPRLVPFADVVFHLEDGQLMETEPVYTDPSSNGTAPRPYPTLH